VSAHPAASAPLRPAVLRSHSYYNNPFHLRPSSRPFGVHITSASVLAMANLTSYQSIPSTTASLDWADLIAIDLSLFDQPGGKQLLAAQLKHAISTVGFFYVPNSGLSEAEVNEQFALAAQLFSLPDEGKQQYRVDPSKQGFFGWEPRGSRKQQHRLVDSLELYDDPKWNDIFNAEYARPPPLAAAAKKCEAFQRHLHNHVLRRLLVLSAIIMELDDEEQLWRLHSYPSRSQCHLRYLLYHPRTPAELATIREHGIEHNVYGHTDFGTFTLLMRQPVAALQVRPAGEEEWKWVKPLKHSITVNFADTLSFLTGGYLESGTIASCCRRRIRGVYGGMGLFTSLDRMMGRCLSLWRVHCSRERRWKGMPTGVCRPLVLLLANGLM